MAGQPKEKREELRARTKELYEQGLGCRAVAEALNEHPVSTYRRLERMGSLREKDEAYELLHHVETEALPFQRTSASINLRSAAVGLAVRWFLDRGYIPSVPLEPARYDLVVDSDAGLKRIQIKSTNFQDDHGKYLVHVHRTEYDSDAESRGTAGKRRVVSYTKDEIDYFFIVTGDHTTYLIPVGVVGEAKNITLGKKYEQFKL